jgi:hypothetical protein
MKIRCKDSQFKPGTTLKIAPDLHLRKLTFDHCNQLEDGERIWIQDLLNPDSIVAISVRKIVKATRRSEVHYTSPHKFGHMSVYPKKETCFYKLLDEESLLQPEAKTQTALRSV